MPAEVTFRLGQLRAATPVTVMHKRFVVEGVVIDPQGRPVAGAAVGQFGDLWGSDFPRTKTDKKGRYRLPPCEAGGYSIAAAAEGYAPDSQWVAVGEGPSTVNLRLRKGEMIRLQIVDKQGRPLPGATVSTVFDNENHREMMLDYQALPSGIRTHISFSPTGMAAGRNCGFRGSYPFPSFQAGLRDSRQEGGARRAGMCDNARGRRYGRPEPGSPSRAAAGTTKVSGKVIDENGKPLAGADVWLPVRLFGIAQTLRTKSDDQGRFVLEISADFCLPR